jgi:hypothetical protein
VTLLSSTGYALAVGLMGAATSCLIGFQNAFKFAESASFWEAKHGQAKDLRDRLRYKVHNEEQFQSVVDAWLSLRKDLLDDMPKAGGLGTDNRAGGH